MPKATTVRFTDEIFERLDQASARTGMPVNSIVVAACLEWMERHTPAPTVPSPHFNVPLPMMAPPPRWATLRRAVEQAIGGRAPLSNYPFERFTGKAQGLLTAAQAEATRGGTNYIGTEHLLLAALADPSSQSAQILARLDVNEPEARAMILKVLRGKVPPGAQRIMPTARVKRVIEIAFDLCGRAGDPRVGTGHILLALATERDGIAAHVLNELGATTDRIKTEMETLSDPEG